MLGKSNYAHSARTGRKFNLVNRFGTGAIVAVAHPHSLITGVRGEVLEGKVGEEG